ncbi:MAG: cytochrome c maturation protein CcmE [Sporomusaceae bacterium]|jgi:cytochrome c-type biogenesis protein CcmE|nr:cytochrome c maturation protein CcmE [Sporomusaceae bacterium]
MKKRRVLSLAVLMIFFVFCAVSLENSLTPYVTFAQAKEKPVAVQVKGTLVSPQITAQSEGISFILKDEAGEEVRVHYQGVQPDNLTEATGIVAIGVYKNGAFNAEKLLVKCPSKYQSISK